MQSLNRWSKLTAVMAMAACAIGGSLVNSSLSQNAQRPYVGTEVGRYQYVQGMIFDTKMARLWVLHDDGKWRPQDAPWEANQKPPIKSPFLAQPPTVERGPVDENGGPVDEDLWKAKPQPRQPRN